MGPNVALAFHPADSSEMLVEQTIGDLLREAERDSPERVFLIEGTADPATRKRLTYRQTLDQAERIARRLLSEFSTGEHLAVWASNRIEWAVLEFGAALAGLTLVMINPAFRRDEAHYVLHQSKSVGIVMIDAYRDNPMGQILAELRSELPLLRSVLRFEDWNALIENPPAVALPAIGAHEPAMIQYTSGTTGNPKGAVLTHFGVVNNARLTVRRLEQPRGAVWLLATPFFHTGGSVYCMLGAARNAGTLVIMPTFESELFLALVEQEGVNYFHAVPTVHLRVIEDPGFSSDRVKSLIGIGSGGTTIPEELVHRLERAYRAEYFMIFGQTELSSVVTHSKRGDSVAHKARTIGFPLPQIDIKVIDPETMQVVPRGAIGEICVRGFGVMKEYFEMEVQTAQTIDSERWLHTGDLGCMDPDGYLRITGRLKDMIIRGGENIFPREIEDMLATHPAVAEAAVLGLPDQDWGEQIAAVVRLKPGTCAAAADLERFVRDRLARHKVPRVWSFVDQFPLTPSGKIKKFVLREILSGQRAETPED